MRLETSIQRRQTTPSHSVPVVGANAIAGMIQTGRRRIAPTIVFTLLLCAVVAQIPPPSIERVSANPVRGLNSPQTFVIFGKGFTPDCSVTLRDRRTGEIYLRRPIISQTSNRIVIRPEFTEFAAEWSVEVSKPDGPSSGEFPFRVVAPKITPSIDGVWPHPVPALESPQYIVINGDNFMSGCVVKLRDKRTQEPPWEIRPRELLSANQIVIHPNFTATPAAWTVEVINPSGDSSGEFAFGVADPAKLKYVPFYANGWFRASIVAAIALATVSILYRLTQKQQEASRRALQLALTAEQNDFYRDLHDGVSSELTKLGMLVEQLPVLLERTQSIKSVEEHIRKMSTVIRSAKNNVDDLRWAFDPQNTDLKSLIAHLRARAREFLDSAGIDLNAEFPPAPDWPITAAFSKHLCLVANEALTNVVKHSGGNVVKVHLAVDAERLVLVVKDNGRGLPDQSTRDGGRGLKNMRQRVEKDLHGAFNAQSDETGTQITVQVPLPLKP